MSFLPPDRPLASRGRRPPRFSAPLALSLVSAVIAVLIFALGYAAFAAPKNRTPQIPQIRVSTRLVKVGVIARDKNGPVTNLTANDFVVLDRGRPTRVSFFSMDANPSAGHSLVAAALPLTRNTFSDVPQRGAAQPTSVTVVLLDNLNTLYGSAPAPYEDDPRWIEAHALANAKQHLIAFVKKLGPTDLVAIYGLSESLHVLCDFTSDRKELLNVLNRYDVTSRTSRQDAQPGQFHIPNTPPEFSADVTAAAKTNAAILNQKRAEITRTALLTIANHLADVPGRKNLIWLTADIPISGTAIRASTGRADLVIYPVDARGLLPFAPPVSDTNGDTFNRLVTHDYSENAPSPPTSSEPPGVEQMLEIASTTGGRAFVNTNDLAGAIRQAIEDSDVTYTIGFYIGQDSIDGKFHRLKIEAKRKGVTLRYPKGYFAFQDTPATKDQNSENLLAAVRSPIESSMIPVHVRIERVETPLPHCLSIFGSIDIGRMQFAQNGGVRRGTASVVTIEQDQTGRVVAQSASTIHLRLSGKEYGDSLNIGFPFHQFVQPKKDASTVRILVEDTSTAEVGSLIIPLSDVK